MCNKIVFISEETDFLYRYLHLSFYLIYLIEFYLAFKETSQKPYLGGGCMWVEVNCCLSGGCRQNVVALLTRKWGQGDINIFVLLFIPPCYDLHRVRHNQNSITNISSETVNPS